MINTVPLKHIVEPPVPGAWGDDPLGNDRDRVCIRVADFTRSEFTASQRDAPSIRSVDTLTSRRLALVPGDVLLERSGETGYPARYVGPPGPIYSNFLVRLRPIAGVDARYLWYVLQWGYLSGAAASCTNRTTMSNLDLDAYLSRRFPLVPRPAQHAIADYLDRETARIDGLIAAKQRMVELLEERHTESLGRVLLGFTSRNPSFSAQEWASALPADWTTTTLGRCLVRSTYGFTNPMPSVEDGPFLITANDIADNQIMYATARHTSENAFASAISDKSRPLSGDVLVTKDGSLGRVALADGERMCINQSVALLRPRPILDSRYLVALLRSEPYQQLMGFHAGGTTIKHIYISRIVKMPIPLPPLDVQRRVVGKVQSIDRHHQQLIQTLDRSVDLLQERRQALITAAVTGQIGIPEAV